MYGTVLTVSVRVYWVLTYAGMIVLSKNQFKEVGSAAVPIATVSCKLHTVLYAYVVSCFFSTRDGDKAQSCWDKWTVCTVDIDCVCSNKDTYAMYVHIVSTWDINTILEQASWANSSDRQYFTVEQISQQLFYEKCSTADWSL